MSEEIFDFDRDQSLDRDPVQIEISIVRGCENFVLFVLRFTTSRCLTGIQGNPTLFKTCPNTY
jgi:hypothetical protein